MSKLAGFSTLVSGLGLFCLLALAHNYHLCQQWYVNPQQPACQAANEWHFVGLLLLIPGLIGLCIAGLLWLKDGPPNRRVP